MALDHIAGNRDPFGTVHPCYQLIELTGPRAGGSLRAGLEEVLAGSMGRRGNPYDNTMMESFMKTLKVEGVYPMAFETAEDVAEQLPRYIDSYNQRRLHSALGYLSPKHFEEKLSRKHVKKAA